MLQLVFWGHSAWIRFLLMLPWLAQLFQHKKRHMCSLQIGEHPRFIGATSWDFWGSFQKIRRLRTSQQKPEKKHPGRIEKSELLSELALQLTDDGVVKKPMTLELDHLLAGVHRPFWVLGSVSVRWWWLLLLLLKYGRFSIGPMVSRDFFLVLCFLGIFYRQPKCPGQVYVWGNLGRHMIGTHVVILQWDGFLEAIREFEWDGRLILRLWSFIFFDNLSIDIFRHCYHYLSLKVPKLIKPNQNHGKTHGICTKQTPNHNQAILCRWPGTSMVTVAMQVPSHGDWWKMRDW